jgi:hypothetical protein
MKKQRYEHSAVLLADGRVLVTGGSGSTESGRSAEIYDPVSNQWSDVAPMLKAHAWHQSLLLPDGRVMMTGDGDTEFFEPATGEWKAGPAPPHFRSHHAMLMLPSGRILAAGGPEQNAAVRPQITADIYDPKTNTWASTPPLSRPRLAPSIVALANGMVMFIGGSPEGMFYSSGMVDLFDERTNEWSRAADMPEQYMDPLVVLLANGDVLVATGFETCFRGDTCVQTYPVSAVYQAR